MEFTIHVWRQKNAATPGKMVTYAAREISPDMSLIEMLKSVNRDLVEKGEEPIAFEADCLEGICGTCCLVINGIAHGPSKACTTCQLHMRSFSNGDHIYIEPWRAAAFPVIKDLIVDRGALDRIIQAGGFVSVNAGSAPDGNSVPIGKTAADVAMDAAQCIGCGACVAACKNGSAMLFTAAKISHLAYLPQGQPERNLRARKMIEQMDQEGFGACTNQFECEAVCPKEISVKFIAQMNREYARAKLFASE
ncbi:succinate dehydrogenase/fumarate reductase iron-sulfur subunit [bacterium]|nr:succinate dehydrogenase/fumarate reductase iron-sulfur subunit [bacterium]